MIDQILEISLPLIAVGAVLGGIGHAIALVLGDGPHPVVRAWHRTRALHPILVGALLGLSDMPVPEAMGDGLTARMIWYCLAGVLSAGLYELVKLALDRRKERMKCGS